MTVLLQKIGIKIPTSYGSNDETLFGVAFYWDTLYIFKFHP